MKKSLAILISLFIAQNFMAQKVQLGPEIGVNIIPMENTDVGYNYQLGFHFGANFKYHFSEKFKLSSGLFLSQKKKHYSSSTTGSVLSLFDDLLGFGGLPIDTSGLDSILNIPGLNTSTTEQTTGTVSELFIEIPVLANYKYKNVNFYLGPYVGILLTANKKEAVTTNIPLLEVIDIESIDSTGLLSFFIPDANETATTNKSNKDNLNLIDFGFNVGLGYEVNNLHFNLMYSYGLLDYRKDKGDNSTETLKTLRISVAYLFDLKKDSDANARFE